MAWWHCTFQQPSCGSCSYISNIQQLSLGYSPVTSGSLPDIAPHGPDMMCGGCCLSESCNLIWPDHSNCRSMFCPNHFGSSECSLQIQTLLNIPISYIHFPSKAGWPMVPSKTTPPQKKTNIRKNIYFFWNISAVFFLAENLPVMTKVDFSFHVGAAAHLGGWHR